jgi:hypothetical protein
VAGYGLSQVHEWAEGVVQSGKSPRRLTVGMMAAVLRRLSPCWVIMVRRYTLAAGGSQVKTSSFWTCDSDVLAS